MKKYYSMYSTLMVLFSMVVNIIGREPASKTPLIDAIMAGRPLNEAMVTPESLKERRNDTRTTPLLAAILKGNNEAAWLILDKAEQSPTPFLANLVNTPDDNGFTPLVSASRRGESKLAKRLLEAGADINATDNDGWSPLHHLASSRGGHTQLAQELIKAGADVNAIADNDLSPLHLAIYRGHTQLAQELIKAGADVNAIADNDLSPLHLAIYRGLTDLAKELIKADADVESTLAQVPGRQSLTPQQKQRLLALEQEVRDETAQAISKARTDIPKEISDLIADQLFPGVRTK